MPITVEACPYQVVVAVLTAMLSRDYVVGFMTFDGVILVDQAVLAAVIGALRNSATLASGDGHGLYGGLAAGQLDARSRFDELHALV